MNKIFENISTNWKSIILDEYKEKYFKDLITFVVDEYNTKIIYPSFNNIFRCFNFFDFEKTSVVILGQDPYYLENMADGLAFSTQLKIVPKSLGNIFKELEDDLNVRRSNCDLSDIAKQNVLLLNSVLTVEKNKPLSHANKGWEIFVDNIIKTIDSKLDNVVFLLMGNNAISKQKLIVNNKQNIICTSHPSPLSYHISFKGSKVFSRINKLLLSMNKKILFW